MKIAVCVFCKSDSSVNEDLQKLFPEHSFRFFEDSDPNKFKSLYVACSKKRDYEVFIRTDFDLCIAINGNGKNVLEGMNIVTNLDNKTLYYLKGKTNQINLSVIISMNLFYSKSEVFDRACECIHNLPNLKNIEKIRKNFSDGEKFFHHLKSIMLTTRCVNFENSSLFIGPT